MTDVLDLTKNYGGKDLVHKLAQVVAVGITETPDTTPVAVFEKDPTGAYVTEAFGTTVPTLGEAGFLKGCEFTDTNATDGDNPVYINVGDETSCNFVTAAQLNAEPQVSFQNDTGSQLDDATLVFISGWDATSGLPTVTKADKNTDLAAFVVVGDTANGAAGVLQKQVELEVDTTGRTVDDDVYLDDTGAVTFTAPTGTDEMQQVVGQVSVVGGAGVGKVRFAIEAAADKIGSNQIQAQGVGVNNLHVDARCFQWGQGVFGALPAPTGSDQLNQELHLFTAKKNMRVREVTVASNVATSGSDATNRYELRVYNKTTAQYITTTAFLTDATELAVGAYNTIPVETNQDINQGDEIVLRVDIKDDGSAGPTDLSSAQFQAEIGVEQRA